MFDSVGDGGPSPRRSPPGGELRNILGNSGDGDELVDDMHHLLDVFNFERFLNCFFQPSISMTEYFTNLMLLF